MVSILDFRYEDSAVLHVLPPGGSEPIATIEFAGPAHEKTRSQAQWLYAQSQRISIRLSQGQRSPRTLDEAERENVKVIVGRMLGWDGIKRRDDAGKAVEVPFSEESATEMLLNPALGWLFEQCFAFLGNDHNFLPRRLTAH